MAREQHTIRTRETRNERSKARGAARLLALEVAQGAQVGHGVVENGVSGPEKLACVLADFGTLDQIQIRGDSRAALDAGENGGDQDEVRGDMC